MREAGILLHISSLDGRDNIGTLSDGYEFIDFLKRAGQKYWQILPINPTSYKDSPYQGVSVYAYNPYFISFDFLINMGLLKKNDLKGYKTRKKNDYGYLFDNKVKVLKKAYANKSLVEDEYKKFLKQNKHWVNDYAAFMVLKELNDFRPWYLWSDDYKYRNSDALKKLIKDNFINYDSYRFIQYLFYSEYSYLKAYAKANKIKIIGDMPIYVAYDSVDVWVNPQMFLLNEKLEMDYVAGCPPDDFSSYGQLWGNPLYDWEYMKKHDYDFWVKRIKHSQKLFDVIRIDHFRGFAGYYMIPNGKEPKDGFWHDGPRMDLFKVIKEKTKAKIIAENLGFLTEDVYKLLEDTGYPGMHVTQFEFGSDLAFKDDFKKNNVIYTSTHDNQTIRSFYLNSDKKLIKSLVHISRKPYLDLIYATLKKSPSLAIIPFSDYIGSLERMNEPSTSDGNWVYRIKKNELNDDLAKTIYKLTKESKR